jgi:O-methyltransferase involved in polyketide biosynthesis
VSAAHTHTHTNIRAQAIDHLLAKFAAVTGPQGGPTQIVSLGAGFDTTFFRLLAGGRAPDRFFEVDFPDLVKRKVALMRQDEVRLVPSPPG